MRYIDYFLKGKTTNGEYQPPYSPNLAHRDYNLFPNLRTCLGEQKFENNQEVICALNAYFDDLAL